MLLVNTFLLAFKNKGDRKFITSIKNITGFYPSKIRVYKVALTHKTASTEIKQGVFDSNERLEFLGDAILGSVIADFLYKKFPFKDEGFLTKMRSRIVSRESLNKLSVKFGLHELVEFQFKYNTVAKSMNGDALEAFIGAVYIDKGFETCRKFIIEKIINNHLDIDELETNDTDFKSQMVEWSQKNKKKVEYIITAEHGKGYDKYYEVQLVINGEIKTKGKGKNKKTAEKAAAEVFLKSL
jgi:ribonuclease-3